MKVLQVIPSISVAHGGPSVAMRAIEAALRLQGIESETATTDDDGPGRRLARAVGSAVVEEEGARRRYFRKSLDPYKVSVSFGRWIRNHVADYDLVHVHALFSFTSTAASRAAMRAGVPFIVRPLGTLNHYGMKKRRAFAKRLSMALVEGSMLKAAAAIHFTSDSELEQAKPWTPPGRGIVLPIGIDLPCEIFRDPATRPTTVLSLSRISPVKNLEGLLHAWSHLKQVAELRLVIAGDGDPAYVRSLQELARQLGVSGTVSWSGHLAGAEKAAAARQASIFVVPSHSESFGLAAVEAMATGLPCVLTNGVALASEVSRTGAGIVVGHAPTDFAAGISRLALDPKLRAKMAKRAAHLARDLYSKEAFARGLSALYGRCVERG